MEAELLTVGTELLLGFTLDTNAADIARALSGAGIRVVRKTTVADDQELIAEAAGAALGRTGLVVVTGGLGPTSDDVTKQAVARLFDAPLELNEDYLAELERHFREYRPDRPMPESNRGQAEIPRGAVVLPNRSGTAPALWLEGGPGVAVLLPGVPHEMRLLLEEEVVPRLRERAARQDDAVRVHRSRTLHTTGITESGLQNALAELEAELGPVTLAYLPQGIGVDLRLTAWSLPEAEAESELARAADILIPALGANYYGEGDDDLAAVVLECLRERGSRLAVAESCTGGLIGARLTAVPGASDVFLGGVVCYADESKLRDLDVPAALLEQHGAVSEEVVLSMARGVAGRFGADAAIAVTGIAGPSGGTPDKPVGTVWLAAWLGESERAVQRRLPGGRREVRRRASQAGLDLLRRLVRE
jgi:nicotinamide-nucleotide amidase